ncbi:sulfatase-like hydrolase/transferase [Spirochaetota bacterium]
MSQFFGKKASWKFTFYSMVLSVYLYVFMEWLFFVTKPSFLSSYNTFEQVAVLLITPIPFLAGIISMFFLLMLLGSAIKKTAAVNALILILLVIESIVLSAMALILFDNFTYTLFSFGIVSSKGYIVYLYSAGTLLVFSFILFSLMKNVISRSKIFDRVLLYFSITLILTSVVFAMIISKPHNSPEVSSKNLLSKNKLPNILIIGADGWSASRASLYGYYRNNAPFIKRYIKESGAILCRNAFSNSGFTGGSLGSLLTGKLPGKTRVFNSPDIFKGIHSYQHLPGILRMYGYRSSHISERDYSDPFDFNLKYSFDYSNFRELKWGKNESLNALLGQGSVFFLEQVSGRIESRIFHLLGISEMKNVYDIMVGKKIDRFGDEKKLKGAIDFISKSTTPYLLHVHFTGTHGGKFYPKKRYYSVDQEQNETFMRDFYDDAIREFDGFFEKLVLALRKRGVEKNTVIVLYSDHGKFWSIGVRVPMVFILPNKKYNRDIISNTQLVDIAPTVLDYLDVTKPEWMDGVSLLKKDPPPARPIFAMKPGNLLYKFKNNRWMLVNDSKKTPPFFSLGRLHVIIGRRAFAFRLKGCLNGADPTEYYRYKIVSYSQPKRKVDIPSGREAFFILRNYLKDNKYDVSSIKIEDFEPIKF